MNRSLLASAWAMALTVLASSPVKADPIAWGFDWSATPGAVTAGTGKVNLSNEPPHLAFDNSTVVATNLKTFSTASPLTPDKFGSMDGYYLLTLHLTDVASSKSGFLYFFGKLGGSFSMSNANVTNTTLSNPNQQLTLGGTTFLVSLNSYTPPGPPNQGNLGSIGAFIQVVGGNGHIADKAPEPSTMLLAGLGAGLGGLAAWRRRRRRAAEALA